MKSSPSSVTSLSAPGALRLSLSSIKSHRRTELKNCRREKVPEHHPARISSWKPSQKLRSQSWSELRVTANMKTQSEIEIPKLLWAQGDSPHFLMENPVRNWVPQAALSQALVSQTRTEGTQLGHSQHHFLRFYPFPLSLVPVQERSFGYCGWKLSGQNSCEERFGLVEKNKAMILCS